jgi:hypothetical protein
VRFFDSLASNLLGDGIMHPAISYIFAAIMGTRFEKLIGTLTLFLIFSMMGIRPDSSMILVFVSFLSLCAFVRPQ